MFGMLIFAALDPLFDFPTIKSFNRVKGHVYYLHPTSANLHWAQSQNQKGPRNTWKGKHK
eukprot:6186867-Pleurochrysis_carterae.AAC.3